MKNILLISAASLLVLCIASACEKELMDFEGKDAIYFDVQYGAEWGDETKWGHQLYTVVSFGKIDSNYVNLNLKVGIAGDLKDYDRPFRVEVVADSTNAIADTEYEGLTEEHVIKAGMTKTYIPMIVRKSDRMANDTVHIQLRLVPGSDFELPFSVIGKIPGRWNTDTIFSKNVDPSIHNIYLFNKLVEPAGWMPGIGNKMMGIFSAKKYELMIEVTGFKKEDFENVSLMQSGRARLIGRMLGKYLLEQYKKGREYWVLDEDGSMMQAGDVPWAAGTRPEDMVGQ